MNNQALYEEHLPQFVVSSETIQIMWEFTVHLSNNKGYVFRFWSLKSFYDKLYKYDDDMKKFIESLFKKNKAEFKGLDVVCTELVSKIFYDDTDLPQDYDSYRHTAITLFQKTQK